MSGFFWGFLLVFLDFSLNLHGHEIGLLPDFVGFLLIFRSANRMSGYSVRFSQLTRLSRAMLAFSAFLYVLDLLGSSAKLGMLGHVLALGCSVGGLFAAFLFTQALFDLQALRSIELHARALHSAWSLLAVCQMVSYLFLMHVLLSTVLALACFGAGIYYLYRLSRCCRAYADAVG